MGYSRQQNQKMCQIGNQHPDRDAQFRYINDTAEQFLEAGAPVISIDTKKKENIGNFKNNGSEYRPIGIIARMIKNVKKGKFFCGAKLSEPLNTNDIAQMRKKKNLLTNNTLGGYENEI